MPFVLKHAASSELLACRLVNRYELPYFGVKDWEDEADAHEGKDAFLAERGVERTADWEVVELDEMKLKMANVKLKNDAANRIFLEAGGALRLEKQG
jgi:hypothetical protein